MVHQILNSVRFVCYKDLKPIYKASTEKLALESPSAFDEKWGNKYPIIAKSWMAHWAELITSFKHPEVLHRIIYTMNINESLHRQLRKPTKSKIVFPSDESLLRMLYLMTMDVTKNGSWKYIIGDKFYLKSLYFLRIESLSSFK